MSSIRTTSALRGALGRAVKRAEKGELSIVDGKNLIGLASQITNSLAIELKYKQQSVAIGKQPVTDED